MNGFNSASRAVWGCAVWLAVVAAGCGREEAKVYRVPREKPSAAPSQALPHGHPEVNAAKPRLAWTLPAGWEEAGAGQMSLASFNIAGKDGAQAQVNITPLHGLAGKEVPIVNMWRQQVGLPELTPEEVTQQLQEVEIAGEPGKMFEVAGQADGPGSPMRIVTAMVHRADASWFYKLAGDAGLVEAQKPAFVAFLKSVRISDAPAAESEVVSAPAEAAPAAPSKWKAPAGWKTVPPGPMQTAKFIVPEKGTAKAEVTVSVFPNATGGTLANVNRWRGQIGLASIDEAELARLITRPDDKNPEVILADMTNPETKRQLIGAIVPRGGQWFFYKLMGDADAVAPQKEAFAAFAKSEP
jgi:hypothetical protein